MCLVFGVAAVLAALAPSAALAGRPAPGRHYFGFPAAAREGPGEGYVDGTGELRVSRSARSVAATTLTFFCGGTREVQVRLSGTSGRRSAVSIGRDGRFAAAGRGGVVGNLVPPGRVGRYRLRGQFLTRDVALVSYVERRVRSRRLVCRSSMKLYRNGVPPFDGCRSQRAFTHLWADTGRVFQQYAGSRTAFFTHVYACLFESPSRRIDLGRNYDDERLSTFRLAGPFVAFFSGGCANCTWDQWSVQVRDLRDGSLASRPDVRSFTRLSDLELKANGSVAWTLERIALGPDGQPLGYPSEPPVIETREVWALDSHGQRLLDSGPELVPDSLEINGSTLYWLNGTIARSAILD
ncbi:MAG TPA: hypothetical protein VF056_13665 [Thermoleophilaceae bacterium]